MASSRYPAEIVREVLGERGASATAAQSVRAQSLRGRRHWNSISSGGHASQQCALMRS